MSHANSETLKRRHQAIRAALTEQNLDALVVTSLPNILYLTNFTGSSAIVVITANRLEFLTDFRYVTAGVGLRRECADLELITAEGSYDVMLVQRLAALSTGSRVPRASGPRGDRGRPPHSGPPPVVDRVARSDVERRERDHACPDRRDRRAGAYSEGRLRDCDAA